MNASSLLNQSLLGTLAVLPQEVYLLLALLLMLGRLVLLLVRSLVAAAVASGVGVPVLTLAVRVVVFCGGATCHIGSTGRSTTDLSSHWCRIEYSRRLGMLWLLLL